MVIDGAELTNSMFDVEIPTAGRYRVEVSAKGNVAVNVGGWGRDNYEEQYFTDGRLENARCEDEKLIVEARRVMMTGGWTSARLTTRGRMSQFYGKIEFSAMFYQVITPS